MRLSYLGMAIASQLVLPVAALADPSTHELIIQPVSTLLETDCYIDANGKRNCVPACQVTYSLRRLSEYDHDDSVSIALEFSVAESISDTGKISRSSSFALKDALSKGTIEVPATKCKDTRFLGISAACDEDGSGNPHCKGFTKIKITNKSKKIRPTPKFLSAD